MTNEAQEQASPDPDTTKRDAPHTIERVMIRALTDRCVALERENDTNRVRWAASAQLFNELRARMQGDPNAPAPFDLDAWQFEAAQWEHRNFGEQPEYRRMYGVMEELGELAHARLKAEQGIRLNEQHEAKARDAVGDLLVFLANLCSLNGWRMSEIIREVWAEVSQRDWTKNKNTGESKPVNDAVPSPPSMLLSLLNEVSTTEGELPAELRTRIDTVLERAGTVMRSVVNTEPDETVGVFRKLSEAECTKLGVPHGSLVQLKPDEVAELDAREPDAPRVTERDDLDDATGALGYVVHRAAEPERAASPIPPSTLDLPGRGYDWPGGK